MPIKVTASILWVTNHHLQINRSSKNLRLIDQKRNKTRRSLKTRFHPKNLGFLTVTINTQQRFKLEKLRKLRIKERADNSYLFCNNIKIDKPRQNLKN